MDDDKSKRLIWIDVETTGLEPARHVLLELAVSITNGYLQPVADPLHTFCYPQRSYLDGMDPVVREMHKASCLVEACEIQATCFPCDNLCTAEERVVRYLVEHTEPGTCPLAGSSVHFDRAFLARHMPRVHAHLGYRNFDVSTFLEAARRWAPGLLESAPQKRNLHRALPDLEDSLRLARYFRDAVFKNACEPPRACEEHGRCWAHSSWEEGGTP